MGVCAVCCVAREHDDKGNVGVASPSGGGSFPNTPINKLRQRRLTRFFTVRESEVEEEEVDADVDSDDGLDDYERRGRIACMSDHFSSFHGVTFDDSEDEYEDVIEGGDASPTKSLCSSTSCRTRFRSVLPSSLLSVELPAGLSRRKASDDGHEAPLDFNGCWKCVETWGMDEFLQKLGVGTMQRYAAAKAPWPSWEFSQVGDEFTYVNHNALGSTTETFVANGNEYQMVDLKKNVQTCRAYWAASALVIERVGLQGKCRETRTFREEKLEFVLDADTLKCSWGRKFERQA